MFSITVNGDGNIHLAGRFDASSVEQANAVLDKISTSTKVDFKELEYISSAGLGSLLKTQKRLSASGQKLILFNMNKLILDIFKIARFDMIFQIEQSG
jgi:anti-sigma B factor antagonist